ncbi:MAG: GAF domain-containing protein [Thermoanaerobaculia bacterium]
MDLKRLKWASLAGLLLVILFLELARGLLEPYLETWSGRAVWVGVLALAMLFLVGAVFSVLIQTHERLEQRNRELLALDRAARDIHGELTLSTILQKVVDQACQLMGAEYGALSVIDDYSQIVEFVTCGLSEEQRGAIGHPPMGKGLLGIVLHEGRHLRLSDVGNDPRGYGFPENHPVMESLLAVPILCQGPFRGNLYLSEKLDGTEFTEQEEEALVRFAATAAVAIEKSYLHHELESVAIAEERTRIGREMHDGMAQVLAYVNTKAQAIREYLKAGKTEQANQQFEQLSTAAREAYTDVRQGILALRSQPTGNRPLEEVLTEYFARWRASSGIGGEIKFDERLSIPPRVELQLLRVIQESLANVRKHAKATKVRVYVRRNAAGLEAVVEDDGVGFDPESVARAELPQFGLAIMRERAESAGGHLVVESRQGAGTRVLFVLPKMEE